MSQTPLLKVQTRNGTMTPSAFNSALMGGSQSSLSEAQSDEKPKGQHHLFKVMEAQQKFFIKQKYYA